MKILDKNKLKALITKKLLNRKIAPLTKTFKFSMEDLQDTPEIAMDTIVEYMFPHQDKIHKFEIESTIDEDTFKPLVHLRMYLNSSVHNVLPFDK